MINRWPLAWVRYTDDLPPEVGGRANGPLVRIRPVYRDDIGLLRHELAHVGVFWMTLGLSLVLRFVPAFRLWNEARAYAEQTKWPDRDGSALSVEAAAERLARPHYGFGITLGDAAARIRRHIS